MDVLADFLSVAGVKAHLGQSLNAGNSWQHRIASTDGLAELKSADSGRLYLYAVACGQIRFASATADHSLNSGDAIFVLERLEHQLETLSEDTCVVTAQIEFTSGSIGLSALGLPSTIAVDGNDDSHSGELVHRLGAEIRLAQGGWKSVSLGMVNALSLRHCERVERVPNRMKEPTVGCVAWRMPKSALRSS